MGDADAASEEDNSAIGVKGFEAAVRSLDSAGHGDDARGGSARFVVKLRRHAGTLAHDKGDGCCSARGGRKIEVAVR